MGLGKACEIIKFERENSVKIMMQTRNLLRTLLQAEIPWAVVNGPQENSSENSVLPNTLSISFPGIKAVDLAKILREKLGFSLGKKKKKNFQ